MKKKKATQIFKTFPFNEVFSDRVYVDVNNDVIYDKKMGVAIAYIHMTHTHMEIMFVLPEIVDDDFEDVKISLTDLFNADNVVEKDFAKFYFRVSNGYYYLGHPYSETNYQIRLPRLFDPADEEDAPETGSAGIEEIDEDEIDCIDLEEFTTDLDAMVEKSIS